MRRFKKCLSLFISVALISGAFSTIVLGKEYLTTIVLPNSDFESSIQSVAINANYTTNMPVNWSVADISYPTPFGTDLKWSAINNASGVAFDGATGVTATNTNVLHMYDNSSAGGIWIWSDPISISENDIYRIDVNAWSPLRVSYGVRFFDINGKIFTPSTTLDTTASYSLINLGTLPTTSASFGGYIRNDIPNNNFINGVGTNANKWATYSKDFVAPKDAVTARVLLYSQHNIATTQIVDWVKVSKLENKNLTIANSTFTTDVSGWTKNNATATKVATGKSFVNATADVMNIVANANNASVISDAIPLYGVGKYSLNFEWRTMAASQTFNYAFKLYDINNNEISTTPKTLTGANVATPLTRTASIPNLTQAQSNITFDVPANASYAKIYFELPTSAQTLQIDNVVAKYVYDGGTGNILPGANVSFAKTGSAKNLSFTNSATTGITSYNLYIYQGNIIPTAPSISGVTPGTGTTTTDISSSISSDGVYNVIVEAIKGTDTAKTIPVSINTKFSGGVGTLASPYLISSVSDFNNISSESSAYYRQTQSIETVTTPIDVFSGNYDGGNFAITVDLSKSDNTADFGLFKTVSGTTNEVKIANLTVKGRISSTGDTNARNVGAVIGNASACTKLTIDNCTNEATITAQCGFAGGILGFKSDASAVTRFINLTNKGKIVGAANTGGIAGQIWETSSSVTISGLHNEGDVSGGTYTGGIVGSALNPLTLCSNKGSVIGASGVGGIVGYYSGAGATKSYNTGEINALTSYAGGIVGKMVGVEISDCYNSGPINSAVDNAGGITGGNASGNPTIKNNYNIGAISHNNLSVNNPIASTLTGTITLTNNYYLGAFDDGKDNTTPKTWDELAGLPATLGASFTTGTQSYPFPQIIGNLHTTQNIALDNSRMIISKASTSENAFSIVSKDGKSVGIYSALYGDDTLVNVVAYTKMISPNGQASQKVTVQGKGLGQTIKILIFENDTIIPMIAPIIVQ